VPTRKFLGVVYRADLTGGTYNRGPLIRGPIHNRPNQNLAVDSACRDFLFLHNGLSTFADPLAEPAPQWYHGET